MCTYSVCVEHGALICLLSRVYGIVIYSFTPQLRCRCAIGLHVGITTRLRVTVYGYRLPYTQCTEFHGILGSSQALHAFDACNRKASTPRWSCSTSTLFVLRSAGIMTTLCSALIARIRLAWLLEVWKAHSSTTRDSSGFCMNAALCRPDPSKPATHVACANIAA